MGCFHWQRKMLSVVFRMKKDASRRNGLERELDASLSLMLVQVLGSSAGWAMDCSMTSPSDDEPERVSRRASVEMSLVVSGSMWQGTEI